MFWMDSMQLGFTKAFMRSGELSLRHRCYHERTLSLKQQAASLTIKAKHDLILSFMFFFFFFALVDPTA